MPDQPDLMELARRYVDLWQDQLTAMAADPDLAESVARFLAMLSPAGAPRGSARGHDERPADTPPRAEAAGAPPRERDPRLDELVGRVAALEERLAALESGARAPRKGTPGKPRRTKR